MSNAWNNQAFNAEQAVSEYEKGFERKDGTFGSFDGQAVMTGEKSGGLIALDIDGPVADDAYMELAGEAYEPMGEETTMGITSGRPGRRQLLYRVPQWMVPELRELTVHKLRDEEDGQGELALRFNSCYTVLPGSRHPDTGKLYRFTRDGDVPGAADAPEWIVDILLGLRKAPRHIEANALDELAEEYTPGVIPDRQLRGWFWKAEIQSLLGQKLTEVVYDHPVFEEWNDNNPRRAANFCPFHGGDSGDTFHVDFTGEQGYGWHCKVCGTGGNPLQFLHAVHEADPFVPMPKGADLRRVIEHVAIGLGFTYPDDLMPITRTQEVAPARPDRKDLLEAANEILRTVRNPAEQTIALYDLAESSGRARMTARDLKFLAVRDSFYRDKDDALVRSATWFEEVTDEEFIIPGLMRTGSQVMIHARGGVGKSETMLALAKAVGRGSEMVIRGMKVRCRQAPVVWISSDQSLSRLKASMVLQDINPLTTDHWFHLVTDWKTDLLHDFQEIVNSIQPALVVIDSLGSVQDGTDTSENEGNYAAALYQMATLNGDLQKDLGFNGCCIAWIHHNTKSGEDFRGTDRLKNALDETWSLRELSEEEEAEYGTNKRILTIGKSRYGRGGDRLLVSRDLEFNYEISDMTPMVTREGINRTGRQTPESLVLEILSGVTEPLMAKEIRERLNDRLSGERGPDFKPISDYGVRKYLSIWLDAGLIAKEEVRTGKRGRAREVWSARGSSSENRSREMSEQEMEEALARLCTPTNPPQESDDSGIDTQISRAGGPEGSNKSNPLPSEPLQRSGLNLFEIGLNPQTKCPEEGDFKQKPAPTDAADAAQETELPEDGGIGLISFDGGFGLNGQTKSKPNQIDCAATDLPTSGIDLIRSGSGIARAHVREELDAEVETGDGAAWTPLTPFAGDESPEGGEEGDFSDAWL